MKLCISNLLSIAMVQIIRKLNGPRECQMQKGLIVNKATAPDHIGARVLKETSSVTAPLLRIIFQCSLDTGIIPDDKKAAKIVPIH